MTNSTIDLDQISSSLVLRQLTLADFDQVIALQKRCFPSMKPWSIEQFTSQLTVFPEGQQCLELDGKIIASASSLIVDVDLHSDWHDWRVISDAGFITNHDPNGDTLYGIEIMVDPEYRGMRLARRLYAARKELCRQRNLARIVIGGRLPGYGKHKNDMSAEEYVKKVVDKSLVDPVLTTQLANGFTLIRLIPDYLPSDEDSSGWATHLEWINLDYSPSHFRSFTPTHPVRLATVQYKMRPIESFDEMAQQVEYFLDVAADYRCDFLVFPELFTLQLLSFVHVKRPGGAARRLAEFTEQYLELFTRLAIKYNVNIIGGSHFVVENDVLYNISYLFHRDGKIDKQYKLHITPSEKRWWGVTGGDRLEVFKTDKGKVAINICYDIEFPELARIAARKGAQIVFCPFNTDERHGYLRVRHCAQARCIENHLFVVTSGCTGNLPFVEAADIHYAQSGIYSPVDLPFPRDGVAAECTPNIETIVLHDVDIEVLRRNKYKGTTLNWNDRRRDLYAVQYTEQEKVIKI